MSIESEGKCSVSASINMMVCVSVVILKILFCVDGSFCNNNACSYELSSGLNYYTILIVLFIKMFLQMFLFGRLLMWTGNLITVLSSLINYLPSQLFKIIFGFLKAMFCFFSNVNVVIGHKGAQPF